MNEEIEKKKMGLHQEIGAILCFFAALAGGLIGGYEGDLPSRNGEITKIAEKIDALQTVHMNLLKDLVILENNLRQDAIAYNQLLRQMAQKAVALSPESTPKGIVEQSDGR